jgi:two-component system sensor histidine kinase HydH
VVSLSIRAKLLVAAGTLIVGSTMLYGSVAFLAAREALLPSIREQLADDAVNIKGGLEEMLTAHMRNVHTWARLPLMHAVEWGDTDRAIGRFLESVHRDYGAYLGVLALDPNGVCVASSDPSHVGRSFAGTAIAGTQAAIPDFTPTVEWFEDRQAWYLRLATSIPDPDERNTTVGTLVSMLDRSALDRIVVPKPGHSRLELRLHDAEGRIIAGVDSPLDFVPRREWQTDVGANAFPATVPPILREGVGGDGGPLIVAEVPIGGTEVLPMRGWHLTASIPEAVALEPVMAVGQRVFATGIVLIALALVVAAFVADRLTRPIKDLTDVAARIGRTGNLEPVPAARSRDEVGELTVAFQRMVSAVASANDEMVRASKLALLGEMSAGIAHEIRTPLGIIRNSAQLLERRMQANADPEATEWAVYIREESDRAARVVTTLLDFVRQVPPAKAEADLLSVAKRAATLLTSESSSRGVTLAIANREPVRLFCDSDQIQQVLLNLMLNALQATPRGGRVDVEMMPSGTGVEIAVRDTGCGIPAELAGQLFEPFTSHREGGIGLGLAIVQRIVRAHGGEVRAANRDGRGAEFVVWLPGEAAGENDEAPPAYDPRRR